MKTEAIHRLINEATEARGAAFEVEALEKATQALLAIYKTEGFTEWLASVDPEGEQAANAQDALKKAGLL